MLTDFDRDVVAIASQPFGITGHVGGSVRRQVPDCLLRLADSAAVVVDVKPARLLDKPEPAVVLDWAAELLADRGWRYEGVPIALTSGRRCWRCCGCRCGWWTWRPR